MTIKSKLKTLSFQELKERNIVEQITIEGREFWVDRSGFVIVGEYEGFNINDIQKYINPRRNHPSLVC